MLAIKKNTVYVDKGSKSRHKVVVAQTKELALEQAFELLKADMQS